MSANAGHIHGVVPAALLDLQQAQQLLLRGNRVGWPRFAGPVAGRRDGPEDDPDREHPTTHATAPAGSPGVEVRLPLPPGPRGRHAIDGSAVRAGDVEGRETGEHAMSGLGPGSRAEIARVK